jgi:hypothetical protein
MFLMGQNYEIISYYFHLKVKKKVCNNVLLGGWTGRGGLKVAAWVIYYRVAVGDDGGTERNDSGVTPFRTLDLP